MDIQQNGARLDSTVEDRGALTLPNGLVAAAVVAIDAQHINKETASELPGADRGSDVTITEYVVKIKTPRHRNMLESKKEISLRLDYSDDPEPGDSEAVESTAETPASDSTFKEDSTCTGENWRSFLSWKTQRSGSHELSDSNAAEFEDGISLDSKPLTVIKIDESNPDEIHLAINSPFLQTHLRKVIDIQQYPGVILHSSRIVLQSTFTPLFHHTDEIRNNAANDTAATEKDLQHMMALYYFVTKGFRSKLYEDVRNKISQGFITHEDIWALFKLGDHVVMRDPIGHPDIAKIESINIEVERHENRKTWIVTLVKYTWRVGQFKKVNIRRHIDQYNGSRKITDLSFYPLSHHEDRDLIMANAIKRGKAWKEYHEREATAMSYDGLALPIMAGASRYPPPSSYQTDLYEREYKPVILSSTVIVDSAAINKATQQATIDSRWLVPHPDFDFGQKENKIADGDFTDKEYMICPSSFTVFSLDDHEWYSVDVAKLKEKQWRPQSFERLVLDPIKKETLVSLAKTNSKMVQRKKLEDVIEGKGRGIVLLLHGPPGVGKTLTAEVLSEYSQRPLLKVNLGRVATHERWEQTLEQIFANAEDWKAILLIDEAEIVLEKRTFERMTQNSWISVFLRKLEYYKGILILTTNLIDCIDEAFESRISYPVKFPELCREDREKIWRDFIKDMDLLAAYKNALLENVHRWSEAEINGRQIRNVILVAENLAVSDEAHPRLTPEHIDDLLNTTIEFCLYNRDNVARLKNIQFAGPSY